MEAYQFLRHRQLIPPNFSLQETAMPNLTWGELIQLLDDYLKYNAVAVKRLTATVEITDFDIATIEALHDLLLDKHNYELNHTTLTNARKLTHKMYEAFKST